MRRNVEDSKSQPTPTVSCVLADDTLVELLYRPEAHQTLLAVHRGGLTSFHDRFEVGSGEILVPFSPENNLIKNRVVMLPSNPLPYESEAALLQDIQAFIHWYVDLSPTFERIASYYVLLTWLYDAFNEVPYLRFRGDYGTGKTRALLVIGSLCYKAFFASGASTVSPIFHIQDAFQGTLVFDEADFRFSDEKAEIVKVLNNGNVRGLPVLRTMMNRNRELNPQAFRVYGPKLVATRGPFEDKALESRFLTEDMGRLRLRQDIPINLPDSFHAEALELRNKLLTYRFRKRTEVRIDHSLVDRNLEPRLNQILVPLLSIVSEPGLRADLRSLAREVQGSIVADRSGSAEAQVLETLLSLREVSGGGGMPLQSIVRRFIELFGPEYDRPVTPRWIGGVLRRHLNIRTRKSHGVYGIPEEEWGKIALLSARYGVGPDAPAHDEFPVQARVDSVDTVDLPGAQDEFHLQ